jgi:hypothetical protein
VCLVHVDGLDRGDGGIHERASCELILLMMVVARRLGAREVCVCSGHVHYVSDRSTTREEDHF